MAAWQGTDAVIRIYLMALSRPAGILALTTALAAGLLAGCIDDPVEYGEHNLLAAELQLAWNTFDTEYVGFAEAQMDWDHQLETAMARMDTVVSYPGLGRVIWQMLQPLQDPGVTVGSYNTGWSSYPYYPDLTFNVDSLVHGQYLDSLGYQQIESSWGYCMLADSTVPLFVVTRWMGFSWGTFDDYFEPLLDSKGMIIDVRLAPGTVYGFNTPMPKLIANRFADQRRVAYFRQYRDGPGRTDLSEPHPASIYPRQGFTGPTLVLMGQQNSKLTERFVSMMGCLPHVTLCGDTTLGNADSRHDFCIGEGTIGVPDTVILAWDSTRIQRHGIAPEVYVEADSTDFAQGVDPVLDYALEWAEGL